MLAILYFNLYLTSISNGCDRFIYMADDIEGYITLKELHSCTKIPCNQTRRHYVPNYTYIRV